MEKNDLMNQFACRLRDAMLAAGFNSTRSTSGVCIHKLAEITGYSLQICRKYLRGEALPEPLKLKDIAAKLNVSPGWLLFGNSDKTCANQNTLTLNRNLLHYIFAKAAFLYAMPAAQKEAPDFLMELIDDVCLIEADVAQSKKIIDLALTSIKHFNTTTQTTT